MAIRPDMPIIVASGFSKNVSAEFVKQAGMQGLLQKPVPEEQLLKEIRRALDAVLWVYLIVMIKFSRGGQ